MLTSCRLVDLVRKMIEDKGKIGNDETLGMGMRLVVVVLGIELSLKLKLRMMMVVEVESDKLGMRVRYEKEVVGGMERRRSSLILIVSTNL